MARHHNINGNIVPFTAAEEAEWDANEAAYEAKKAEIIPVPAYVSQRASAYPPIGDQLDMLWHSIDQNPELKQKYFDFYEAIKQVKVKYPKNG
tara:strand:- start:326 stop:604 length:279 start_codon:yes stop_codon:yes gene_type:complete